VTKIVARFDSKVYALRAKLDTLEGVIGPEAYHSLSEELTTLERTCSQLMENLRDPVHANLPDPTSFRISLQKIEALLNEEKKKLS